MDKKVTTNDIAKTLGISRGTVSKALNGKADVDQHTRRLIIETAADMGYRRLDKAHYGPSGALPDQTIVLMIREARYGDAYWSLFIKNFEDEIIKANHHFTINVITIENENLLNLPGNFSTHPPSGIVTIGPFKKDYYLKIKSSDIPVVYVDTAPDITDSDILADTILMCNREYVYEMTSHLIKAGHKRLGFLTDYSLCRSFADRWEGFCDALKENNLSIHDDLVFGKKENQHISVENISNWFSSITEFPTAFVCANDFYAVIAKTALLEIGISVPRDLAICGFDNDSSISMLYPQLTSVDSHVEHVARRAFQELLWRIANPDAPYELIKITSTIHYRNSTEGYVF